MRVRPLVWIAAAAAALVPLPAPASAAIALRASVAELARACERAVDCEVTTKHVRYQPAEGRIWTEYTVKVKSTWVGTASENVTVRVPGGTVGNVSQEIRGVASLSVGTRYVLFLWKDKGGHARVLGMAQGAFQVDENAKTGALTCRNDVADICLVNRAGTPVAGKPVSIGHAEFKRRVVDTRTALDAAKKARNAKRLRERRKRARVHAARLAGRPGGE